MRIHDFFLTAASAAFVTGAVLFSAGGAYAQQLCNPPSERECSAYCASIGSTPESCTTDGGAVDCQCAETTKDNPGNAFGTATSGGTEGTGNLQETGSGNKPVPQPCEGNQGQCKKQ